ncbi:class I SAM-dependent methyltransferase [Pedobacter ginsengiterrae]|uniref:Class I SAM-dependent methyltransferase n=1 Tax=Pedobacter ginsengiterrae TaxID=871696 RepID=A0ABP7PG90_9SPHI
MNTRKNILDCYSKTAEVYAQKYFGELEHKHFDKMILQHFARERALAGTVLDLGCGPGQTTAYLDGLGIKDIIGTDISCEMIDEAKRLSPHIAFETADMLDLSYPEGRFGSAVAFYAMVHFDYPLLAEAFRSVYKVLKPGGHFLTSFHLGDEIVHLDHFLDHKVDIDFNFFKMHQVIAVAQTNGFQLVDAIEREAYSEIEYPSKRGYLWLKSSR